MVCQLIEATLADICSQVTDGTHDTPKAVASGFPLIKAKEIVTGSIDFSSCDLISEVDHKKVIARSKPEHGDTLFTHIGACLGAAALVRTHKEFSIKNIALFKANPKIVDSIYLYYYVTSSSFQDRVKIAKTGAAQPFLGLAQLRGFPVRIHCDLTEQRRIASILSAYDDLIENNTRRIAILEEMARRVYEEWFVRFRFPGHETVRIVESELGLVPEGWHLTTVGDCITIHRGKSYKSSELVDEGGLPFVNLKCMERDGGFRKSGLKRFLGSFKETQKVVTGDLVMAVTDMTQERRIVARCGRVPRLGADFGVISMDLVKIEANKSVPKDYMYAMFRWSGFADEVKQHANGANVLHLLPDRIADFRFHVPPADLVRKFADLIESMLRKCDVLAEKNEVLRTTRDLLLPKLISGELDVSHLPEPEAMAA